MKMQRVEWVNTHHKNKIYLKASRRYESLQTDMNKPIKEIKETSCTGKNSSIYISWTNRPSPKYMSYPMPEIAQSKEVLVYLKNLDVVIISNMENYRKQPAMLSAFSVINQHFAIAGIWWDHDAKEIIWKSKYLVHEDMYLCIVYCTV